LRRVWAFDPKDSQGLNVGNNAGDQTVAPGESRTYTYYAHPANKETTSLVWDGGNIVVQSAQRIVRRDRHRAEGIAVS
jgi:hypothetical protein